MKHLGEFRKREPLRAIIEEIRSVSAGISRPVSLMEICGSHTHAISKSGLRYAMPTDVNLISGPGCPVCVTSQTDVDRMIAFAASGKAVIATFGDMMRVPGSISRLDAAKAAGASVEAVYSPLGALDIARREISRDVVFYSVGFETTAPAVAASVLKARDEGIENFSILSLNKLTPPAMKALLDSGEAAIDGFICPGHVTAITGADAYGFIARDYGSPCVVAGFEPLDLAYAVYKLLMQIKEGRSEIEIEYKRVVRASGNAKARAVMEEVFEPVNAAWRGIGVIPNSGLTVRDEFSFFNAEKRFDLKAANEAAEPAGCICGSVIKGVKKPRECPLFSSVCTPSNPAGPCMVSSEGTCAAYYKYMGAEAV